MADLSLSENKLVMLIKASNNDKYNRCVNVYVGCSGQAVCAVFTMSFYLEKRKAMFGFIPNSPLFTSSFGNDLSKTVLNKNLKNIHDNVQC